MLQGATYRWGVRFVIPGLQVTGPVQIGEVALRPIELDENGRPQAEGYLVLDYAECVQHDVVEGTAKQTIESLADACSLIAAVGNPRSISARLENEQELRAMNKPVPLSVEFRIPFEARTAPIGETRLRSAFMRLTARPPEFRILLHRVSRWMRRAYGEVDPFDCFSSRWIAFNMLYRNNTELRERQAIEAFVDHGFDQAASQALIQRIGFEPITALVNRELQLRGNRRISEELREAVGSVERTGDYIRVLRLLALTLYALRNYHFYGDLSEEARADRELVAKASIVLNALIVDFLLRNIGPLEPPNG